MRQGLDGSKTYGVFPAQLLVQDVEMTEVLQVSVLPGSLSPRSAVQHD